MRDVSSYCYQFQIYTEKVDNITERNLGARVVCDLIRSLVGKGYNVHFDNFFNNIELQQKLQSEIIYAFGSMRKVSKKIKPNSP